MRRLLPVLLLAAALPSQAATYLVESHHTQGVVRWNHLGFSFPTAQFARVEGVLVFDPAAPAKAAVKVNIPLAAMTSGLPDLDEDLRSDSFFDLAKYPEATFTSRTVEARGHGRYRVGGDLVVHGVTRRVVLDATLNGIGTNPRNGVPSIGFEATTRLKRSDFGLGRFVPQVGDEVEIRITLQGEEAQPFAAYLRRQAAAATDDADRKQYETAAAAAEAIAAKAAVD
ncbi:MAG TPA: YceI family protein [Dokdonella sp.]|nr:YceI family protein [Dokdonella sp.]